MCQLLGMNCATPTDFSFSFKGFCQRGGNTDKHEHGWGISIYEGPGLRTFLDTLPAAVSKVAKFVETYPLKTLNCIAHIRYATQGTVSLANVHPFSREMWGIHFCFAHNGEVPKCTRKQVRLGRTKELFYHPVGDTDSEAVFCAILNALRAEFSELPTLPVLYESLQRLCAELVEHDEESTILNFLLGCGQYTMFAYSWPGARPGSKVWNGLFYTIRRPPFSTASLADVDYSLDFSQVTTPSDRVAVIATAPLTVDEEWNEFNRGQLLMFDNGSAHSELYDCQEVERAGRGLCSNAIPKAECTGFDTPALLCKLVESVVGPKADSAWAKRGVDLGCGSGNSGAVFRNTVEFLTGVDLSSEMVDKAKIRGVYDELLVGDIELALDRPDEPLFDIIFACNVFSFIRDIRAVFEAVRNSLKPVGGIFAFSAEFIQGTEVDSDEKLVLQSCARYAHNRAYIESIADEFAFETKAVKTSDLRQHEGRSVQGVLVVMSLKNV